MITSKQVFFALAMMGSAQIGHSQTKTFETPEEWRRRTGRPPLEAVQPCPISVLAVDSSSNAKTGLLAGMVGAGYSSTWLILKYQNASGKRVAGIRFAVAYFNSVNEFFETRDITTPTLKLKPGKATRLIMADGDITNGQKMRTSGWVAKVSFSDGTEWSDDGTKSCSASSPLQN
jgi:hypothetical protein